MIGSLPFGEYFLLTPTLQVPGSEFKVGDGFPLFRTLLKAREYKATHDRIYRAVWTDSRDSVHTFKIIREATLDVVTDSREVSNVSEDQNTRETAPERSVSDSDGSQPVRYVLEFEADDIPALRDALGAAIEVTSIRLKYYREFTNALFANRRHEQDNSNLTLSETKLLRDNLKAQVGILVKHRESLPKEV